MSRLEEVIEAEQAGTLPVLVRTLAAEVDARDEVITKLLEMLDEYAVPGGKLYARACEIAGRAE